MIATITMMNTTPPTTPPMTGARGKLFPPSFEPLCIRFVGEERAVDEAEVSDGVEEIKSVVVVVVPNVVDDWSVKGQGGQHGEEELGYSQRDQLKWLLSPLSAIFFVHDADVAQGREGLCAVKGRGRGEYLEKYTWPL